MNEQELIDLIKKNTASLNKQRAPLVIYKPRKKKKRKIKRKKDSIGVA